MSKLLPYETIVNAHEGDPAAMNEVLSHYVGYIRYCSHIYGHFNVDMEDYIKTKLIVSSHLLNHIFMEIAFIYFFAKIECLSGSLTDS